MRFTRIERHRDDARRRLTVHLRHAIRVFEDIHGFFDRVLAAETIHREVGGLHGGFFGGAQIVGVAGVQGHELSTSARGRPAASAWGMADVGTRFSLSAAALNVLSSKRLRRQLLPRLPQP